MRRLARLFRDVNCFAPPDASGHARRHVQPFLGVEKEVRTTYVATSCFSSRAHEGHAFVVEAAVSVGGLREEEEAACASTGSPRTASRCSSRAPNGRTAGAASMDFTTKQCPAGISTRHLNHLSREQTVSLQIAKFQAHAIDK